ncbi:hypothetical protein ONE63_003560 [Megalurothrips usitatus]|uniref:Uncharacterized protein n=1 Tax=Megalurothrips usitatus TaxID=439358 RepID=A0AAV7X6G9_9NEOP|nr:hypothetical protein ONE63_003560 [Megalurothrips usitatus]
MARWLLHFHTSVDGPTYRNCFRRYSSRTYAPLLKTVGFTDDRLVLCETDHDAPCLDRFQHDANFVLLRSIKLPDSLKCLTVCNYALPDVVQSVPTVFYMRKHYPLAPLFDQTIHRLHAAGIVDHWVDLHLSQFTNPMMRRPKSVCNTGAGGGNR